jgi:diguanylate cyclase (GGDEF)-like protein
MDVQIEIARRFGRPLSLLLLDVDDFKQYNDEFGHSAGDEVLKALASVLCNTARRSDCPARYGGEEFAVILPETDRAGATRLGERYRAAIADASWPYRRITSSVGAATICLDAGDARLHDACITMLVEGADRALYTSKANGKNQLTHVQELATGASADSDDRPRTGAYNRAPLR